MKFEECIHVIEQYLSEERDLYGEKAPENIKDYSFEWVILGIPGNTQLITFKGSPKTGKSFKNCVKEAKEVMQKQYLEYSTNSPTVLDEYIFYWATTTFKDKTLLIIIHSQRRKQ
ncbi:MAG: hypothetical protein ACFFG0_34140 [Candidatus Thorarchaeota archaeon]